MRPARQIVFASCALAVLAAALPATAAPAPSDQIDIVYVPPKNPAHQPIYEALKAHHALEQTQTILSPFRLPRRLTIKVDDCDGQSNAWYEQGVITICYEYLEDVGNNAPTETFGDFSPIDALAGPFFDVLLHEFGHALIELLALPVLGREEAAADQIAAYMMLQFGKDEVRRLIRGAAYAYRIDLEPPPVPPTMRAFASVHGTPAQRLYDLLCIAYGADPALFKDFVQGGHLPRERAENCEQEYAQVAYAFHTLVRPHIDRARAAKVLSRRWLPDVKAPPPHRPHPTAKKPESP